MEYIQAYHLAQNVFLHGYVEDMVTLRQSMDIELICSRCEGFGRSTVEGMLSRMVVVAADCGATPEIITHEKTGFLYPPEDREALVALLLRIGQDTALRERIGIAAQRTAKEKFGVDRYVQSVVAQWNEVVVSQR